MTYLVVLLLILLGGINYSNSLMYGVAFLLGSVMLVCMLHTHRNLNGLALELRHPEPTFAGHRAVFPFQLQNPQDKRCHALEFFGLQQLPDGRREQRLNCHSHEESLRREKEDASRDAREPPGSPLPIALYVPPNVALFASLSLPTEARGWLLLHRVRVSSRYPMGLFRAWATLPRPPRCLVYPRPEALLPLPPPPMQKEGESTGREPGAEDFQGMRRYQPGDPPRSISWKSLGSRELLVGEFVGGVALKLYLSWQHVSALHDQEAALSQLCTWVLEAREERLEYGLDLPGMRIPPGQGEGHCNRCLRALALYGIGKIS